MPAAIKKILSIIVPLWKVRTYYRTIFQTAIDSFLSVHEFFRKHNLFRSLTYRWDNALQQYPQWYHHCCFPLTYAPSFALLAHLEYPGKSKTAPENDRCLSSVAFFVLSSSFAYFMSTIGWQAVSLTSDYPCLRQLTPFLCPCKFPNSSHHIVLCHGRLHFPSLSTYSVTLIDHLPSALCVTMTAQLHFFLLISTRMSAPPLAL